MIAVNRKFCGKKTARLQGGRCIIESTTCHDDDGDNVKFKERWWTGGGKRCRWRKSAMESKETG